MYMYRVERGLFPLSTHYKESTGRLAMVGKYDGRIAAVVCCIDSISLQIDAKEERRKDELP
jgi:hypothetical protein